MSLFSRFPQSAWKCIRRPGKWWRGMYGFSRCSEKVARHGCNKAEDLVWKSRICWCV